MSRISSIVKNPSVINQYLEGIIVARANRQSVYDLTFEKESNGGWYIVLPEWKGAHANLAMVAGSDMLLDHLLEEVSRDCCNVAMKQCCRVNVEVVKSAEPLTEYEADGRYIICRQTESSLFGGATYDVSRCEGFDHDIWICPVTLFVLGEYPKYIYIRLKD